MAKKILVLVLICVGIVILMVVLASRSTNKEIVVKFQAHITRVTSKNVTVTLTFLNATGYDEIFFDSIAIYDVHADLHRIQFFPNDNLTITNITAIEDIPRTIQAELFLLHDSDSIMTIGTTFSIDDNAIYAIPKWWTERLD